MECYVLLTILCSVFILSAAAPFSKPKVFDEIGEYGEYFEGDMVLTAVQRAEIDEAVIRLDDDSDNIRNGLIAAARRWPKKTVVYHIAEDQFDEEQIEKIENALADIANLTCIKFRKRENISEHAVILQGMENGCYSSVGFMGANDESDEVNQVLNLASGCFKHGTIIHEMLHTLGFYHMQSTYDRDDFVTIIWQNISPGMEHNFAKYTNDTVTDFGVPYDYGSVMHYSRLAFSKNGMETIVPKQENITIGQRSSLSESDLVKLNKMYECSEEVTTEKPTINIDNFFDFLW